VKRFWWSLLAVEVAAVVGFCFAAAHWGYLVRMPASVRRGQSLASLIVPRAIALAGIFSLLNGSIFFWIQGVHAIESANRSQGAFAFLVSTIMFIFAGLVLVGWVLFGFAQY
jgi:uncharacterized membrane protein